MAKHQLRRRNLLAALGLGTAALPLLPMLDREAQAADGFAKRFIVFCTTTGMTGKYPGNWRPQGGETDFALSPILSPLAGGYDVHGTTIGDRSDDVIITQGIDMAAAYDSPSVGGHPRGMGVMLTGTPNQQGNLFSGGGNQTSGWGGGISIDQHIANHVSDGLPYRSLELGVDQPNGVEHLRYVMSYKGPAEPVPVESDPYEVFDTLFGDFVNTNAEELAILRKRRRSVLDFLAGDLTRLESKLGKAELAKLEAHHDAIRAIEKQLEASIDHCVIPDLEQGVNPLDNNAFPTAGRLQMDMLIAAMSCGLTNVGSLMWGTAPYGNKFSFLGGADTGYHTLSHEPASNNSAQNKLELIARFYVEQFAYLLQRLADIPEGDGTMLDNTVVLWTTEVGNPDSHTHDDMPIIVAGGAGGYFQTGRFLDFGGVPNNQLFVSICHAMGLNDTQFGHPQYGDGPLVGMTG